MGRAMRTGCTIGWRVDALLGVSGWVEDIDGATPH